MKRKSIIDTATRAAMTLLLAVMTTATAWALDPRPIAVYCDANKTLYLTYGDPDVVAPFKEDHSCLTFTPEGSNETLVVDLTMAWASDNTVIPSGERRPSWTEETVQGSATTVVIESSFAVVRPTSLWFWFAGFTALASIQGMENLNTSEVTTMKSMFNSCSKLTTLDLSFFNTSKVTDMQQMFDNWSKLESIYIGDGWNTSLVTSSNMMFYNCTSIVGDDGTTYQFQSWDKTRAHANAGGYMRRYPPINLSDDSDNTAALGKAIADKEYRVVLDDRTIYCDGDWNTLCLPFSVSDLTGTPLDGFTVKELDTKTAYDGHLTGLDGSTLYLNFKDATGITAGVPYILKKLAVKDDAATPTYTATAGTAGSIAQQGYDKLVDGSVEGYRWRTDISGGYCEFNADAPVLLTGYTLTTSNQSADYDPLVWTLQAKVNAGDAWTVIDSRNVSENGGDALPSGRTTGKTYTVQKQGTYQYFRFEVTQTNSTHLCLSELTLQACYSSDIDNIENPTFTGVTVSNTEPASVASTDGTVSFVGTYSPVGLTVDDQSNLFLGAANTLYWPNGANNADGKYYVGACRAYFHVSEPTLARAFVLNFGDALGSETGIISIPVNGRESGSSNSVRPGIYALDGRRVASDFDKQSPYSLPKGVYIVNGRKIVIK